MFSHVWVRLGMASPAAVYAMVYMGLNYMSLTERQMKLLLKLLWADCGYLLCCKVILPDSPFVSCLNDLRITTQALYQANIEVS